MASESANATENRISLKIFSRKQLARGARSSRVAARTLFRQPSRAGLYDRTLAGKHGTAGISGPSQLGVEGTFEAFRQVAEGFGSFPQMCVFFLELPDAGQAVFE
jgi:nitrogenase molybdenum-iron protein alpha/beta subunit